MKYLKLIGIILVFASCTRFLIGERKLIFNNTTQYIIPDSSIQCKNMKFFLISIDKIKDCRDYPDIAFVGHENRYSFFKSWGKLKYANEITEFALPDSICVNKYSNTIDYEFKLNHWNRFAIIVNDNLLVEDTVLHFAYNESFYSKRLSYDATSPYIEHPKSENYKNGKFYAIPFEKIIECRGFPYFNFIGCEGGYSFFTYRGYMGNVQKGEIIKFALPDSICVNKYPNTIDEECNKNKNIRQAKVIDKKVFVADF